MQLLPYRATVAVVLKQNRFTRIVTTVLSATAQKLLMGLGHFTPYIKTDRQTNSWVKGRCSIHPAVRTASVSLALIACLWRLSVLLCPHTSHLAQHPTADNRCSLNIYRWHLPQPSLYSDISSRAELRHLPRYSAHAQHPYHPLHFTYIDFTSNRILQTSYCGFEDWDFTFCGDDSLFVRFHFYETIC